MPLTNPDSTGSEMARSKSTVRVPQVKFPPDDVLQLLQDTAPKRDEQQMALLLSNPFTVTEEHEPECPVDLMSLNSDSSSAGDTPPGTPSRRNSAEGNGIESLLDVFAVRNAQENPGRSRRRVQPSPPVQDLLADETVAQKDRLISALTSRIKSLTNEHLFETQELSEKIQSLEETVQTYDFTLTETLHSLHSAEAELAKKQDQEEKWHWDLIVRMDEGHAQALIEMEERYEQNELTILAANDSLSRRLAKQEQEHGKLLQTYARMLHSHGREVAFQRWEVDSDLALVNERLTAEIEELKGRPLDIAHAQLQEEVEALRRLHEEEQAQAEIEFAALENEINELHKGHSQALGEISFSNGNTAALIEGPAKETSTEGFEAKMAEQASKILALTVELESARTQLEEYKSRPQHPTSTSPTQLIVGASITPYCDDTPEKRHIEEMEKMQDMANKEVEAIKVSWLADIGRLQKEIDTLKRESEKRVEFGDDSIGDQLLASTIKQGELESKMKLLMRDHVHLKTDQLSRISWLALQQRKYVHEKEEWKNELKHLEEEMKRELQEFADGWARDSSRLEAELNMLREKNGAPRNPDMLVITNAEEEGTERESEWDELRAEMRELSWQARRAKLIASASRGRAKKISIGHQRAMLQWETDSLTGRPEWVLLVQDAISSDVNSLKHKLQMAQSELEDMYSRAYDFHQLNTLQERVNELVEKVEDEKQLRLEAEENVVILECEKLRLREEHDFMREEYHHLEAENACIDNRKRELEEQTHWMEDMNRFLQSDNEDYAEILAEARYQLTEAKDDLQQMESELESRLEVSNNERESRDKEILRLEQELGEAVDRLNDEISRKGKTLEQAIVELEKAHSAEIAECTSHILELTMGHEKEIAQLAAKHGAEIHRLEERSRQELKQAAEHANERLLQAESEAQECMSHANDKIMELTAKHEAEIHRLEERSRQELKQAAEHANERLLQAESEAQECVAHANDRTLKLTMKHDAEVQQLEEKFRKELEQAREYANGEVFGLSHSMEILKQRIAELEQAKSVAMKECASRNGTIEQLQEYEKRLEDKIDTLLEEKSNFEADIAQMVDQISVLNQRVNTDEDTISSYENGMSKLESQLKSSERENTKFKKDISYMNKEVMNLINNLNANEQKGREFQKQVEELRAEGDELRARCDELLGEKERTEEELSKLRYNVEEVKEMNEAIGKEASNLKKSLAKERASTRSLMEEVVSLKDWLHSQDAKHTESIATVESQLAENTSQFQDRIAKLKQQITELHEAQSSTMEENEMLKEKLTALTNKLTATEEKRNRLKQRLSAAEESRVCLQEENEMLKQEKEVLEQRTNNNNDGRNSPAPHQMRTPTRIPRAATFSANPTNPVTPPRTGRTTSNIRVKLPTSPSASPTPYSGRQQVLVERSSSRADGRDSPSGGKRLDRRRTFAGHVVNVGESAGNGGGNGNGNGGSSSATTTGAATTSSGIAGIQRFFEDRR